MFLCVRFLCLGPRPRYVYHAFSIPVATTYRFFCTPAFTSPKIHLPPLAIAIHDT